MDPADREREDAIVVDEILVLLQEKRTALAMIRTGIGIIVAQMFVLGLLMVTSKYYNLLEIMHLMIPFVVLNIILLLLGIYLIWDSLVHLYRLASQVRRYKQRHSRLVDFID